MSAQAVLAPAPPVAPASIPAATPVFSTPKISVQEYFEIDRNSEIRYEYVEGELIAMPGTTPKHNRISVNFITHFDLAFADRDCEVYIESIRLRVSAERFRYPDVIALCGEAQFDNENPPCLLNPGVIIEVLSPSTQYIDQGDKLFEYRQMPALTDYVMVAQERIFVEHCVRLSATEWKISQYSRLDDTLTFASLGVTMALRDVYRRTPLAASEDAAPAEASG